MIKESLFIVCLNFGSVLNFNAILFLIVSSVSKAYVLNSLPFNNIVYFIKKIYYSIDLKNKYKMDDFKKYFVNESNKRIEN